MNELAQSIKQKTIYYELWKRGAVCKMVLDETQKQFYDDISKTSEKVSVILSSRRLGKSFFTVALAVETCLKKPGAVVKFLAPTKIQIDEIVRDLMPQVLSTCPEELKPKHNKNKFLYTFPNGSEIRLAGSDSGHIQRLRGGFADLCIVDEAGFCTDLVEAVRGVLIPTTLTTNGKILLLSTPPKELDHEFFEFVEDADNKGVLYKKTIYDNKRLTQNQVDEIISSYPGGVDNVEFRREYLCEILKDETTHVIPEFTDSLEKKIVKEWERPPFFDYLVTMDLGFKDLTAVLFGYYDFKADKLIIEDEIALDFQKVDSNIRTLAKLVKDKELELFGEKKPYGRYSDLNPIVIKEIREVSNGDINFWDVEKTDKMATINVLRMSLYNQKIIINPKCKTLIKHVKNTRWKGNTNVYLRNKSVDHGDFLDCLIYMVKMVNKRKNPYPDNYMGSPINPTRLKSPASKEVGLYKTLFNIGTKKVRKW